jgi:hypothetical protein
MWPSVVGKPTGSPMRLVSNCRLIAIITSRNVGRVGSTQQWKRGQRSRWWGSTMADFNSGAMEIVPEPTTGRCANIRFRCWQQRRLPVLTRITSRTCPTASASKPTWRNWFVELVDNARSPKLMPNAESPRTHSSGPLTNRMAQDSGRNS